jgi:DNA-binding FadR family transcriptional regulator
VVDQLREESFNLQLKPSSSLDEVMLSDRFKFSRSSIREALIKLAGAHQPHNHRGGVHCRDDSARSRRARHNAVHFCSPAALLRNCDDLNELGELRRFVCAVQQHDADGTIGERF